MPHPARWHRVSHQLLWLPGTVGDALQYQLSQTGFSAQILDKVCGPLSTVWGLQDVPPPGNEGLLAHSYPVGVYLEEPL